MPLSRDERIYLAYKSSKKRYAKEGRIDAGLQAMLYVCKLFSLNILQASAIIRERRKTKKKK